jgi:hypothetical protein
MKDLILNTFGKSQIATVKSNADLITSNLLQLREIERYQKRTGLSMNDAAIKWIDRHALRWRIKHPLSI